MSKKKKLTMTYLAQTIPLEQVSSSNLYCQSIPSAEGIIPVSFQLFGQPLFTAPIVVVVHALTGNSNVSGDTGWWSSLIGAHKTIDTDKMTVIGFNIPGNGYDGFLIENYQCFTAKKVAKLFIKALDKMHIQSIHSLVGGSLGGGIAWEMAAIAPQLAKYLIPIATDWKSTDWIIGHNRVQERILQNSNRPLQDARMMAMLFYRTPESLGSRFKRSKNSSKEQFEVASWLDHHGNRLSSRFELLAYKMMNHLLSHIDVAKEYAFEKVMAPVQSEIIQIGIDSDIFFVSKENIKTKIMLDEMGLNNHYFEISSIHGHDAFLMEYEQLNQILTPFFR